MKAGTGEYVWHYQSTPADTWDYDAVSPMTVVDLTVDGKRRHVILQPCKNGFFYMLEAADGKLLRAVPLPESTGLTAWTMKTGRPRVKPEARFPVGTAFNLEPGVQGAHGWQANAYSPQTRLLYFPTQVAYFRWSRTRASRRIRWATTSAWISPAPSPTTRTTPDQKAGFSAYLQAWDPVAGKQVWKGESNQGPTGGALATAAGLVFHAGGSANEVRAYDARTGEKLWSYDTQTGSVAPPISFEFGWTTVHRAQCWRETRWADTTRRTTPACWSSASAAV